MEHVSAEELVQRLRESIGKVLRWAEAYQPHGEKERVEYDADLDETEDLLDEVDAWVGQYADRWSKAHPPR